MSCVALLRILVVFAWCAGGAGALAEKKLADLEPAFRLFLQAQADILEISIYRPPEREIIRESLRGLERELGPKLAHFFPRDTGTTVQETWEAYVTTLRALADAPETGLSLHQLVEKSLRAYCATLDRYSTYDDRVTVAQADRLKRADYVGVGVTLQEVKGGFACNPFPGGAADRAGLVAGDGLLAVDDKPVEGLSLMQVAVLTAGPADTEVRLRVRHADGVEEVIPVKREEFASSPIEVEQAGNEVRVALRRFTARTVQDLRALFRTLPPERAITLDLRGCPGGALQAAVDTASLFLPADTVICRLETRRGVETFVAQNAAAYRPSRLTLLQDGLTASGAEIVIVALLSHRPLHAESRGEQSYGKGVTLRPVEISQPGLDGGVLTIADGKIYGPNREAWDGEGLSPTVEVEAKK